MSTILKVSGRHCFNANFYKSSDAIYDLYQYLADRYSAVIKVYRYDDDYWIAKVAYESQFKSFKDVSLIRKIIFKMPGEVEQKSIYIDNKSRRDLYFSGCGHSGLIGKNVSEFNQCSGTIYFSGIKSKRNMAALYLDYLDELKASTSDDVYNYFIGVIGGNPSKELYGWVANNIQYGREKDSKFYFDTKRPEDTFLDKYGVCSDAVALLSYLYDLFGIKHDLVFVSTQIGISVPEEGVLWPFDHIVIYLEDEGIILDPVDSSLPYGAISSGLLGSEGLFVKKGEILEINRDLVSGALENKIVTNVLVDINSGFSADMKVEAYGSTEEIFADILKNFIDKGVNKTYSSVHQPLKSIYYKPVKGHDRFSMAISHEEIRDIEKASLLNYRDFSVLYYVAKGDIEGLFDEMVCDVSSDSYRSIIFKSPYVGRFNDRSLELNFGHGRYVQSISVRGDLLEVNQSLFSDGRTFCDSKDVKNEFLAFLNQVKKVASELDQSLKSLYFKERSNQAGFSQ